VHFENFPSKTLTSSEPLAPLLNVGDKNASAAQKNTRGQAVTLGGLFSGTQGGSGVQSRHENAIRFALLASQPP
jgi:hypothetical protein